MAKIGRKQREALRNVEPIAVPVEERADRETVAQIMDSGARMLPRLPQSDFAG
jgi:hypothetical protein